MLYASHYRCLIKKVSLSIIELGNIRLIAGKYLCQVEEMWLVNPSVASATPKSNGVSWQLGWRRDCIAAHNLGDDIYDRLLGCHSCATLSK